MGPIDRPTAPEFGEKLGTKLNTVDVMTGATPSKATGDLTAQTQSEPGYLEFPASPGAAAAAVASSVGAIAEAGIGAATAKIQPNKGGNEGTIPSNTGGNEGTMPSDSVGGAGRGSNILGKPNPGAGTERQPNRPGGEPTDPHIGDWRPTGHNHK